MPKAEAAQPAESGAVSPWTFADFAEAYEAAPKGCDPLERERFVGAWFKQREWFARKVKLEDGMEVGVGFSLADEVLSAPPAPDAVERADRNWLEREKQSGHCGEGTAERQERALHNDRIDRLLSVIDAKAAEILAVPGSAGDRDRVAEAFRKGAMAAIGCAYWDDADDFFTLVGMGYSRGEAYPSTMPKRDLATPPRGMQGEDLGAARDLDLTADAATPAAPGAGQGER